MIKRCSFITDQLTIQYVLKSVMHHYQTGILMIIEMVLKKRILINVKWYIPNKLLKMLAQIIMRIEKIQERKKENKDAWTYSNSINHVTNTIKNILIKQINNIKKYHKQ